MAYYGKGVLYFADDLVKHIDNYQKAASLHRGPVLPEIFRGIGMAYAHAGFKEKAIDYVKEALILADDSAAYYNTLGEIENCNGNFGKSIEFLEKSYAIDSTDLRVIRFIAQGYLYHDQFEESLEYYKKFEERLKTLDRPVTGIGLFLIGYAYWVNGFNKEAEYYFNRGLERWYKRIELGQYTTGANNAFYPLAGFYAFRGDRDKAYEYLRLINQKPRMPLYFIKNYKFNPLFDNIRDEPEFQQFLRDVEAKYQAEHERVRKWLEENDML
jgi:tetratricopeptide (TPR) repeat protein